MLETTVAVHSTAKARSRNGARDDDSSTGATASILADSRLTRAMNYPCLITISINRSRDPPGWNDRNCCGVGGSQVPASAKSNRSALIVAACVVGIP